MAGNATQKSLDDVINKLQDALEEARHLPDWSLTMIIMVSLLCVIILLHVLALLAVGPCLWGMWLRRKRLKHERLLAEDDALDSEALELTPSPDAEASEDSVRIV